MNNEFHKALNVAGEYVALGNIYINKPIDAVPAGLKVSLSITMFGLVLIIPTLWPCPPHIVKILLRFALAIGCAGITSQILGNLTFRNMRFSGLVFILILMAVFFSSFTIKHVDRCEDVMLHGRLLIGDKPLAGAKVWLPAHAGEDITNSNGDFDIHLDHNIDQEVINVRVEYKSIDTQININHASTNLQHETFLLHLPDTIPVLSAEKGMATISEHISSFRNKVNADITARFIEFEGLEVDLETITKHYRKYEHIQDNYRNEFEFESPDTSIYYRKNLIDMGIDEVDPLEPFLGHHIQDHKALLIMLDTFGERDFIMEYAIVNNQPSRIIHQDRPHIMGNKATMRVKFEENIMAVLVRLEYSNNTGYLKKRKMTFYGVLPEHTFNMLYRNQQWRIEK